MESSLTDPTIVYGVFCAINLLFVTIYLMFRIFHLHSNKRLMLNARVLTKKCYCTTSELNKQPNQNAVKICLRIVYELDRSKINSLLEQELTNLEAKLSLVFCNITDKRLFKIAILIRWLLQTNTVNDLTISNVFFGDQDKIFQLYRLNRNQYMFKFTCLVDNCRNFFDDLLLTESFDENSTTTAPSSSRRSRSKKRKRSRKPRTPKTSRLEQPDDVINLHNYVENLNRVGKVFVQLCGVPGSGGGGGSGDSGENNSTNNDSQSGSRTKFKRQNTTKANDDNGQNNQICSLIRLHNITLELMNNDKNDKTNNACLGENAAALSDLNILETFYCTQTYEARLTEMGIFYELIKYTLMPEQTRFFDKYLHYTNCRLNWHESIGFLYLAINSLAFMASIVVNIFGLYLYTGFLIYSLAAVISCVFASLVHLLILYVYKSSIKLWILLKPARQNRLKNIFTWLSFTISIIVGALTFLFIYYMSNFLNQIWLYSFLLALCLYPLSAILIWYLLAIWFDYFENVTNYENSNNENKSRQQNRPMNQINDLINPLYENKTLSTIFTPY